MIKKEDVFKIGQFAKPHGIKGEITLLTTSDVFDDSDDPFIVCEFEGILVPFFIEEYRYKSDSSILVKLENIDSELQAREFSNLEVYYPLDAAVGDLVGDMTWDGFVGYVVFDTRLGILGPITMVDESTINVLLQVDYKGNEILIPAAEELILGVDHDKKLLEVALPDGLLDL